jgi:hypothetical protein
MTVHNLFDLLMTASGTPEARVPYARIIRSVKRELPARLRLAAK